MGSVLTGKSIAQLCSLHRTSDRFLEMPTRRPSGLNTHRIAASRANQNITTQNVITAQTDAVAKSATQLRRFARKANDLQYASLE
jgi:hypothetical protein